MSEDNSQARLVSARINRALGLFLLFFGLVVLSAVFFTPDRVGKLTNASCALVLVAIGGGMILHSKR